MNTPKRTIWFPAKTYGYGWGPPVCWQGWVVVGVYVILLAGGAIWFLPEKSTRGFVAYAAGLSLALTGVCWLKGEKPAWRWGRRD
ncbi:MAG TPA: hypothetical protein VL357_06845 [Rariglobus sp.]|jgi:hypothetical protein|nr:hypothetical protein [Rariglobus sp.]